MKPLDLAFSESRRHLGWVLFVAGAALLSSVPFLRQRMLDVRAELVAEQTRFASQPPSPPTSPINPKAQADQARLQLASDELGRDWERLFAPIERAATPELRLLSIEPDVNAGNVVITADAPNYETAVEYTERLGAYGLKAVTLQSHAATPNADAHVRVKVGATWSSR